MADNIEPTDQDHQKRQIEDAIALPKLAKITKVYYHTGSDDNNNIEVDVETHDGESYQKVWWMTPSPGMVTLPQEGYGTILTFLSGENEDPVAIGNIHTHKNRSPVNKEGDFRIRLGNAVIETRKQDENRLINVGFQPEDGGSIKNGIVLEEGQTPKIIDENGNNLLVQQSPGGGGGSPGGQASGFESIPTGGAGGDGTGIGKPGFNISNTVDAVQDLGLDNNGNSAINSALENVGSNTEVVFPKGTYLVQPTDDTGITIDGNDIWLHGKKGQNRGDVKFQVPSGKAGTGFTFTGSNTGISNATFDHSNHEATVFCMTVSGSGNKYFYNIQHIGKNLPSLSLAGPLEGQGGGKKHCWGISMDSGSICHIENYKWTDPETRVEDYPNGLIGIQAPLSHAGTIELVNNHMAWRSEHNVYASRCSGGVHVTGGYYHNSCNTNMRIEGSNSYIEDATIHVDMDPNRASQGNKGARGLWWENNKSTASSGGRVTNCDFVYTSQVSSGNASAIKAQFDTSGVTIENSRFHHGNNTSPCIDVSGISGVTVSNCHFTGSTDKAAVQGNGDTDVQDCCLSMSNSPGFQNCNVSGTSSGSCERPSKVQ